MNLVNSLGKEIEMSNLQKNYVFVLILSFVLLLSLSIPSVKADIIHGEFAGDIRWLNINNNPHSFYIGQTCFPSAEVAQVEAFG